MKRQENSRRCRKRYYEDRKDHADCMAAGLSEGGCIQRTIICCLRRLRGKCARVSGRKQEDGYVWADAHAAGDDVRTGYYAVYHAAGELAARNVRARGAAVYVMFPQGSREEQLAGIAAGVDCACRELEIQVTSFQGEVSGAVVHTVVSVSAAGVLQDQKTPQKKSGQNSGKASAVKSSGSQGDHYVRICRALKELCVFLMKHRRNWRQGL